MQTDRLVVTLQDFSMLSQLGLGNYSKVILVRKKDSGRVYAMKIIKKSREHGEIKGIKKEHAYIQKEILMSSDHPFIVRFYSTFQKKRKLYFVMEYCPGGELFGLIRRLKRLSQESAKFYAAQLLMAIEYLHSRHFIYRDLKPQNILIDQYGYVRLIDFGLSCREKQLERVEAIAGTPEYLPPQLFEKGMNISPGVDWWAFGNIVFQMIAGFPPFFVQHQKFSTIKKKICTDEPPLYFISNPLLKDLLQKLLNKNPKQRLGKRGAEEIKNHGWFYGTDWQCLLQKKVEPPFKPEIKNDADTHWFEVQPKQMSPPESSSFSQKSGIERYQQFTSSWKSSRQLEAIEQAASPPEVVVNISELSPK